MSTKTKQTVSAALGADNTCVWRLDRGNLCEYAATAKLRKETKQFMTFDLQIAGGTLDEEWHVFLLAFRGTVTLQDWLTNVGLRSRQKSGAFSSDCR